MKNILCKLGFHKYSYDSPSQPCYCTCLRCKKRWHLKLHPEYDPIKEWDLYQQWEEIKDEKR